MVVDIDEMRLAYDERINRMIPAPSGVLIFDPEEEKNNPIQRVSVVEVNYCILSFSFVI